ncbi:MAG: hypothetical protein H0V41_11145 [Pseudonocardiales bacterium]|nr:hypothetical protein [Pseudonocardiales bacterium]
MSAPLAAPLRYVPLVHRLPRRVRAALLVVHVVASAGWLGLDGALVALKVTGLHSGDPAVAKSGIAVVLTATGVALTLPRLQEILAGEGEPAQALTLPRGPLRWGCCSLRQVCRWSNRGGRPGWRGRAGLNQRPPPNARALID